MAKDWDTLPNKEKIYSIASLFAVLTLIAACCVGGYSLLFTNTKQDINQPQEVISSEWTTPESVSEPTPTSESKITNQQPTPLQVTQQPNPKPTQQIRTGVHPGASCDTRGENGYTSSGTLMQCKPSTTDSRNRWRAA